MPTTSQGIYYPDSITNVAPLHTVLATVASSIDTILSGDVQVHRVANTTARNALVSQFPPSAANPLFVWRADATGGRELEYTKNGTTWHYVSTSEDDTGWVAITPAAGFTAITGGAHVRRIGTKVMFRGGLSGSMSSAGTAVGTVPVGFRPAGIDDAVGAVGLGSGAVARGAVSGSGVITIIPPATVSSAVYLAGLPNYLV